MKNERLETLATLTDAALVDGLKTLIVRERDATAEIVAHLAELDTRDVHLRAGYPSLYVYCRDAVGLTEWEAYNRIEVARTARRFPIILKLLAEGAVSLTAVRLLAPHLTVANHHEVLAEARGKRKDAIKEMVARLSPQPDVASSLRRIPDRTAPVEQSRVQELPLRADPGTAPATGMSLTMPPATTMPLSPDRYKYQVTISGETLEKMRLAADMLGHAVRSGDDAEILDRAFTALLVELARKKFADTPGRKGFVRRKESASGPPEETPVPSGETSRVSAVRAATRTVPAAVKRVVWVRDLGRCAFVGEGGHRCNERRFVEFHHVDPHALGGEATVDGIQLRCRPHNDYEGRLYFGVRRPKRRALELVPEQVAQPPR